MIGAKFRSRIELQAPTEIIGERGGVTVEWANAFPGKPLIPAEFKPAAGRTTQEGNRLVHEWPAKFVIRWMPGVTDAMRVQCDGVAWEILGVSTDPTMRREITLEVVGRGED